MTSYEVWCIVCTWWPAQKGYISALFFTAHSLYLQAVLLNEPTLEDITTMRL